MRTMLLTLPVVALLAAGCAKQPAPPAPVLPAESTDLYGQPAPQGPTVWQPGAEGDSQQRTSSEWSVLLNGPNPEDQARASKALGELAEAGFPQLLNGMQSDSAAVRLVSLQAVYKPVMVTHADQTWPVLQGMLKDSHATIRRDAVVRLTWFEPDRSKTCIPALQAVAKNDADADVRRAAEEAVLSIQYAVSLKKPKVSGK